MRARYEEFSFDWHGLTLTCRGDFEPSERDYPGYQGAEVLSISLDDPEELLSHGIMERCSEGTERIALALMTMTGSLFPTLEKLIMSEWQDEMAEAAEWAWDDELS